MVYACQNCGKKAVIGRNVSHSKVRTPRVFRPNLQKVWIVRSGKRERTVLCTKCLRKLRREQKILTQTNLISG